MERPELKYPAFRGQGVPSVAKSANLFDELRKKDILLHHPFDSYATVEEFIEAGAAGPGGDLDEADALPDQRRTRRCSRR